MELDDKASQSAAIAPPETPNACLTPSRTNISTNSDTTVGGPWLSGAVMTPTCTVLRCSRTVRHRSSGALVMAVEGLQPKDVEVLQLVPGAGEIRSDRVARRQSLGSRLDSHRVAT